jgi:hypothetical protein
MCLSSLAVYQNFCSNFWNYLLVVVSAGFANHSGEAAPKESYRCVDYGCKAPSRRFELLNGILQGNLRDVLRKASSLASAS